MIGCFVWQKKPLVATMVVVIVAIAMLGFSGVSQAANPPILAIQTSDHWNILTDTGGIVNIHVYHVSGTFSGASGAMFRVGASAGFTGVLVSEEYPLGSIWGGNVTDGLILTLPHVLCDRMDFDIVTLTYQPTGTSAPCSYLEILAHPDATTPLVSRCDLVLVEPRVQPLWVNFDDYNGCPPPVATEPTTWGKVKALYRN